MESIVLAFLLGTIQTTCPGQLCGRVKNKLIILNLISATQFTTHFCKALKASYASKNSFNTKRSNTSSPSWNFKSSSERDFVDLPFCTLSQSKNTSSLPLQQPACLSIRQIFKAAAPGDSTQQNCNLFYKLLQT